MLHAGVACISRATRDLDPTFALSFAQEEAAIGHRHDDIGKPMPMPAGFRAGFKIPARHACCRIVDEDGRNGRGMGGEYCDVTYSSRMNETSLDPFKSSEVG